MLLGHAEGERLHADMVATYLSHPEAFPVLEVLAPTCCELVEGPGGAQFAGLPLLAALVPCSDYGQEPIKAQSGGKSWVCSCLLITSTQQGICAV